MGTFTGLSSQEVMEEMRRARRVGRPSPSTSTAHRPGAPRPPGRWDCMEASSRGHDRSLTLCSASPFSRAGGWGQKVPASSHGLFFLVTSPIQEPSRCPPGVASLQQDSPVTQEIARASGAPCQDPVRDQREQRLLRELSSRRTVKGSGALCQGLRAETKLYFL